MISLYIKFEVSSSISYEDRKAMKKVQNGVVWGSLGSVNSSLKVTENSTVGSL